MEKITALRRSKKILACLLNPKKRGIIELLRDGKRLTTTQVFIKLRFDRQHQASRHLSGLRDIGVVSRVKKQNFQVYSINKERLEELEELFIKIGNK